MFLLFKIKAIKLNLLLQVH